jgi:hypothetical protein
VPVDVRRSPVEGTDGKRQLVAVASKQVGKHPGRAVGGFAGMLRIDAVLLGSGR